MPRGHLIVEKDSIITRGTWPRGEAGKPWLRMSGRSTQTPATDPQVVFEWIDKFDPAASREPQIVILFDIVEPLQQTLLAKLDAEHLEDWCTWLHYGGEIELAKLAPDWDEHWRNRALTSTQRARIQSSMGFPLPTGDSIDADWSRPWRNFKRCVNQAAPFDRLWSAIERSRTTFELAYAQWIGPPVNQIVEASIDGLRAGDITAVRLHEIAQDILRMAPSPHDARAASWQSALAICRQVSPLAEASEVRSLAEALAKALEAAHVAAKA